MDGDGRPGSPAAEAAATTAESLTNPVRLHRRGLPPPSRLTRSARRGQACLARAKACDKAGLAHRGRGMRGCRSSAKADFASLLPRFQPPGNSRDPARGYDLVRDHDLIRYRHRPRARNPPIPPLDRRREKSPGNRGEADRTADAGHRHPARRRSQVRGSTASPPGARIWNSTCAPSGVASPPTVPTCWPFVIVCPWRTLTSFRYR